MSLGKIGIKFSKKHKENMSKAHKGHQPTEETRKKLGKHSVGNK